MGRCNPAPALDAPERPRRALYGHAKDAAGLFSSPTLSERLHRSLACRFVAVCRPAVIK
jgi:hypothetical protein